jgi:hypothetical protein
MPDEPAPMMQTFGSSAMVGRLRNRPSKRAGAAATDA